MVRAIREYRGAHRLPVGFKPAGGIRTAKDALDWLILMKEELGDAWLHAGPVPHRREQPAHRHRAPARTLRHRPLLRPAIITRWPRARRSVATWQTLKSASPRSSRRWIRPGARGRRARAGMARRARAALRPLHRRRVARPQRRRVLRHASTRPTATPLADIAQGDGQGRGRRRARRARGVPGVGGALGPRARALSLCARPPDAEALAPARRAGDDGQRQADPRDPRHRYPARRAPLLPSRRLGAAARQRVPGYGAGRRRRPDHPLELPAADAGLEDRARARRRQHRRAEARRIHAAHRARLRRDLPVEVGLPAGVVNIVTGDGAHRRGARRAIPTSTRSPSPARPRSAASSARPPPARGKKLSLELGGKSPFIVFDDADLDSVVEGVVDAIWFNQGQVCCAGSRLLVQESVAERAASPSCARAWRRCASATRSTRRSTSARSSRRCSWSGSRGWCEQGVDEGARMLAAVVGLPDRRLLLSADALHRASRRPRPSRRWRSSGRCSSP